MDFRRSEWNARWSKVEPCGGGGGGGVVSGVWGACGGDVRKLPEN